MKNMKKKQHTPHCPYCGHFAVLKPASFVYGDEASTKHLYVCTQYPKCDSYVGVHESTLEPMGTLANAELRKIRIRAHRAFDRIWQSGIMSRDAAYQWLRYSFGLTGTYAHIGVFSDYYCELLVTKSNELLRNNKIA